MNKKNVSNIYLLLNDAILIFTIYTRDLHWTKTSSSTRRLLKSNVNTSPSKPWNSSLHEMK